jgi:hypothetical protein
VSSARRVHGVVTARPRKAPLLPIGNRANRELTTTFAQRSVVKFSKRGAFFKVAKRGCGQLRQVMSAAALLERCPIKWVSMRMTGNIPHCGNLSPRCH